MRDLEQCELGFPLEAVRGLLRRCGHTTICECRVMEAFKLSRLVLQSI